MSAPLHLPTFACAVATRKEAHQAGRDAYAAAWQIVANGGQARVMVNEYEDDISVKQRAFLHGAVLPQISHQVKVDGVRFTADIWKEFFRQQWLPDTWESRHALVFDRATRKLRRAKRATPHRVRHSTEELGVRRYSEFIDRTIDHAVVEWGVEFVFRASEREAVRYVRPKKRAALLQAEVETC